MTTCMSMLTQIGVSQEMRYDNVYVYVDTDRAQWLFKQLTVIFHQHGYLDECYIRNMLLLLLLYIEQK